MPDDKTPAVPTPNPEQRKIADAQFTKAKQAIASNNFDYGINLLLSCCKIDPANMEYRTYLRVSECLKYKNNMKGKGGGWLSGGGARARIKASMAHRDYLKAMELAEQALTSNPWDVGVQMDLAAAATALGLLDIAVWSLEQARKKSPNDLSVNRTLALAYEQRGNYSQAMALWELIRRARPRDQEAQEKVKNLAAYDTITRGQYAAAAGAPGQPAGNNAEGGAAAPAASPLLARRSGSPQPADRLTREVAALRARLQADPTGSTTYLQLAAVYRRVNDLEQARAVLRQGLGPTGNSFELAQELADLDIEPFRRELTEAETALRTAPDDAELRSTRDRLEKEVTARELELYRAKAERYPTEMAHRFQVGLRLYRLGQIDEAIRELQAARVDPRHRWQALMHLGYCFKARNNWRLAQQSFKDALQSLPAGDSDRRKELLYELATGSAGAGDYSQAVDLGHELANLDFGYKDINRLLDDWAAKVEG
jgi:tetratricopeptide (TPR) repeat protein